MTSRRGTTSSTACEAPTPNRKSSRGQFHWDGRLTGPWAAPPSQDASREADAQYGSLYWDDLEGELTYSPDELHIARGRARRGRSSADLELQLDLDNWSFDPESEWTFDVNLVGADTDDLQKMLGTSYAAHGHADRAISWQGHAGAA